MSGSKAKNLALLGANVDATGEVDSNTIDGIDSAQFLRSDQSDTMTGALELNEPSAYSGYEFLTLSRAEPTRYRSQIGFGDYGGGNKFGLSFTTRNDNTDYRTMTMVDGNVGINTTAPNHGLHIKDKALHIQASNAQILFSDVSGTKKLRMDNSANLQYVDETDTVKLNFEGSHITFPGYGRFQHIYQKNVNLDRSYRHVCNVGGGPGYASSVEFSVGGTSGNTVSFCTGQIAVGHSSDCAIATFMSLSYTPTKIKVVSDANNNMSIYMAINSYNNQLTGCRVTIRPLGGEWVNMDPTSAYSSLYMEHTAGLMTSSASAAMPGGTGPANGY